MRKSMLNEEFYVLRLDNVIPTHEKFPEQCINKNIAEISVELNQINNLLEK